MILKDGNKIYLIFYFSQRLCQGIDNCFYALGNTRNTTQFEPFHIAQPIVTFKCNNGE